MRHSACSNASRSVANGAPLPGIEGAPRGAHCTATAAATAAVAKAALACSAALCFHNPAPRIRRKYLPGWLISSPQRKRFCTLLLPRPRARKAAGCAMPSMPQTCKESAPCVPSRSGIGLARQRCDEHHRPALSVRKSERGAAAGHGTRKCYCTELHSTKASLLSEVPARCPVETGGVADFAARSIDVCAARRRSNARSSRHAHAPACAAAPRPAKAASTAAVGSNNWARGLPF
jgi:hypothetical protein